MNPTILIGGVAVILISVILLVVGLSDKPTGQELVEERLGGTKRKSKKKEKAGKRESVVGAAVDRAVAGRGFAQNLATQLARANLKWTVGEFIVMTVIFAAVAGLLFFLLNRIAFVPLGIFGGFFLPRIYLSTLKNKRLKAFNDQLSDALNLMVNSLRAGYSTMQAMEVISNEMPAPISEEFGRVVLELQLGVTFDDAMTNLLRRMPSADMDLVITAMSVQREVGGNLAEVLDSISFTIRERVRIKGEIRVLTSQQRYTAYLIGFLPVGLGLILYAINKDYMGLMFSELCGWIQLAVAVTIVTIGFLVIRKIVAIEV